MTPILYLALTAFWIIWWYPFLFRAPHFQNRRSITSRRPTAIGLTLEVVAIAIAFALHFPLSVPRTPLRIALSVLFGAAAAVLAWTSVTHLGRQFRITAGLYEDHELVTTGPYGIVRHPIYASLLAMLLCTLALLTPIRWAALSLAIFAAGTEIRVRTEDGLLAARFGERFNRYRGSVSAYLPFVR
jgi:protein-S-isoprenylcysteine O-methyltransferase Ste14